MGHGARRLVWQPWKRVLAGLALAGLSAALFTLAFPPYGVWPLILFGLVPMVVAQHRVMPDRLASVAYAVGIGGFFAGYFGAMFEQAPWFMRALPLFIAVVAGLGSLRERAFHRQTGYRWLLLHGPAVWVGIEMIRGVIPTVGTWGFAAYALFEQAWFIQPVSVFGTYGLSLLILLVNYTLALAAIALFDRHWRLDPATVLVESQQAVRSAAPVGLILLAWLALSGLLLRETQPTLRVAAVQPALVVETDEGARELMRLTRQVAEEDVQLIVWHEGAVPFDPQDHMTDELRALAGDTGAHLVIGYLVETPVGFRNESVILTPDGEFLGPFGKDHPVAWSGETSVTRGPYEAYETDLGMLGMMICYDLDFTDTARHLARAGARMIAVPSFDWPAIASKHYTHLVFRAVENRVAAIKADVAFNSAIIGPYGRILERAVTPEGRQKLLVADVALGTGTAPAVWLGDWVGWLSLVAMVGFAGADLIVGRD